MSAPVLDVRNLSVSYLIGKQRARAAADISFTLSAGERLGIVGESGSGKSTLALALMRCTSRRPASTPERPGSAAPT